MPSWRRLFGGLAGLAGGLLWTPIILFLVWLPRLSYPDEVAYGAAAAFVLALAAIGFTRPRWGGRMLAVAAISWMGLAILMFLRVIEPA